MSQILTDMWRVNYNIPVEVSKIIIGYIYKIKRNLLLLNHIRELSLARYWISTLSKKIMLQIYNPLNDQYISANQFYNSLPLHLRYGCDHFGSLGYYLWMVSYDIYNHNFSSFYPIHIIKLANVTKYLLAINNASVTSPASIKYTKLLC
jgi:hypothetical protein